MKTKDKILLVISIILIVVAVILIVNKGGLKKNIPYYPEDIYMIGK